MKRSGSSSGKKFALVFIFSAILVFSAMPMIAMATDWQQFQKDKIHTGWTTDNAPVYDPELAWWKHTSGTGMGGIDVSPIVGDGATYVLDYQGVLWSFDATTGIENWHTYLTEGSGTFEVSVPAYNEGIVYAAVSSGSEGEGAGRVCAVHANNGSIRECEYYGLQYFQLNTPITYADGKIYFGNWKGGAHHTEDNGTYYCVDASDVTNEIWHRTAPYVTGYYWAGAAIVGDYLIYGDDRANVTCLNKDTGAFVDYINASEQCGVTPVEELRSSIVWNESTGRIYFTGKKSSPLSGHAYAVAFNAATGDLSDTCEWATDIGYSTSTPAVYNGRVYVCIGGMYGDSGVRCLNEADGTMRYSIDKGATQASPAASVVDGHVYIYFTTNVNNGSAYCIEDIGTALVERWEWNPPYPDDQFILQGMAISDGVIYFGTDYGRVYALKEEEGQVQFDIPIYNGKNLIAIPLIQDDPSLDVVFGDNPTANDRIHRYNNSLGLYKTSRYTGTTWWHPEYVEPIEPEVGYVYERVDADYTLTIKGTRCTGTISTPIYNGKNLIGYVNFTETTLLATFGSNPVANDRVHRYNNSLGLYKTSRYTGTTWWHPEYVEPIEVGVGYVYERVDVDFDWMYEA